MSEYLRGSSGSGPVKADHDLNVPDGCRRVSRNNGSTGLNRSNSNRHSPSGNSKSRSISPKGRSSSNGPYGRRRSASARKCRKNEVRSCIRSRSRATNSPYRIRGTAGGGRRLSSRFAETSNRSMRTSPRFGSSASKPNYHSDSEVPAPDPGQPRSSSKRTVTMMVDSYSQTSRDASTQTNEMMSNGCNEQAEAFQVANEPPLSTRSSPAHPSSPVLNFLSKSDTDLETQRLSIQSLSVLERILDTQHHALVQMGVLEPAEDEVENIENEIRKLKLAVKNIRPRLLRSASRAHGPDPVSMRIGCRRGQCSTMELDTVPARGLSPARNGTMNFTGQPQQATLRANCQRNGVFTQDCDKKTHEHEFTSPDHTLRHEVLHSPLSAFQELRRNKKPVDSVTEIVCQCQFSAETIKNTS